MSRLAVIDRNRMVHVAYQSAALWAFALVVIGSGCAGSKWIKQRRNPATPLAAELGLFSWRGPRPTARTAQRLRRYDLTKRFSKDPVVVLEELLRQEIEQNAPEHVLAIAEVGYIAGSEAFEDDQLGQALDLFAVSVAHAYRYLLDPDFEPYRNPFDPQFRQASDLYNGALENVMRIVQRQGQLKPGMVHVAVTETHEYEFHIETRGPWSPTDIEELHFASDFELQGLKNHYRTYGLGVPLIAVNSRDSSADPAAEYYAPGMSMPVTAFVRVLPSDYSSGSGRKIHHHCVIELHDPLQDTRVEVNGSTIPLETDLSTPLAYALNDPVFKQANVATVGLLNLSKSREHQGLYLLEPYDPNKTPVLMVHGLWSSLVTWMEMFNDLRGVPEIRDNYQFWFYLYPSGQPLLLTATQLREELKHARESVDPKLSNEKLNRVVLVGHSMGGLVARLQTLDSGEDFWRAVSDVPVADADTSDPAVASLRRATVFQPNPFVARVVTIASPHHGSAFSNEATRWLGRRLISLPEMFERTRDQLLANTDLVRDSRVVAMQTSIDSLSPTSPVLNIMQQSPEAPWVKYHNIIGIVAEDGVLSKVAGQSDGVVTVDSARLDSAVSELMVDCDHVNVHRHPKTVLEVQRILLEHLDQQHREIAIRRLPEPSGPQPFEPRAVSREEFRR